MNRAILLIGLCLLCSTKQLFAVYEVAICAIFRNEAPYMKEWIEFHKLQGVQHFYLYNNNSSDDYIPVLEPYVMDGLVTLVQWPMKYKTADHRKWLNIQTTAYMDCIRIYGDEMKWLAVIDTDEFLYCLNGVSLPQFLREYSSYAGLAVNWRKFGTSYVDKLLPGMQQIEILTRCTTLMDRNNSYVKSIIQPRFVTSCTSPHWFYYTEGSYAVTVDKKPMALQSNRSLEILIGDIRINHYWSRTEEYLMNVKIPGRQARRDHATTRLLKHAEKCNVDKDDSILYYKDALKSALNNQR